MRPTTTTKTRRACRKGRPRRAELSAPGIPYSMRLADGRTVFVEVPARTAVRDRGGELAFTPEGVRFLDRIRALASNLEAAPSPAFITALREAAGFTQEELGRRIGRHKLTVSRWECGTLHPDREAMERLRELFRELRASGVILPG
ncbi:MAG: helix-turn-helix domain-containing protein [Planctomycetota bacterium]|nr:helix-turn-helix domain-containing protein [Planctomycetota bacterium]